MATALDVITDALQMLGVYDPNETLTDADAQTGLSVLNDMLDSWSNESLTTFAWLTNSFPLVANQQSYTVGPGGNFNTTRPLQILTGPGTCFIRDTNSNDYPVDVVAQDVWNLIGLKDNTSDIPDTLFYDPQFPLGIINMFPVPIITYTLFFSSQLQLADLPLITTPISLPPGYKLALGTNLAVALKPYFADGNLDPIIIERAAKSLGNIKRTNMREIVAVYDSEIVSRTSPTYNIYRDRSNGAN